MKLQDIHPILNETDEIEIRSCWENKKLFATYKNKNEISIKYGDCDVVEISQRCDKYIVIYINRVEA